MAANDNVNVNFTASTGNLNAGIATTKAELADLQSRMQTFAQQAVASGATLDTNFIATMKSMSTEARQMGSALKIAEGGIQSAGAAAGRVHGNFSAISRELIVLGHEASQGRYSRLGGSLMVLAEYAGPMAAGFAMANPLITAAGVAAVAAAGALAYLAAETHLVKVAQDDIARGTAFSGNFGVIDPKVLDETRQKLESLKSIFHGLGEDDIAEMTVEFARMGNASDIVIKTIASDLTDVSGMWKAFGKTEEEASNNLVKAFSEPLGNVDKIGAAIGGINEKERQFILTAQRANDPLKAQAAIQQVIADHAANYHLAAIAQIDEEIAKDRERQATTLAGDQQTRRMLQENIDVLQKQKAETQAIDASLAGWAGKIAAAIAPAQNLEAVFRQLMHDTLPQLGELETVQLKIAKISSDMASAGKGPDDNRFLAKHTAELQAALDAQIAKEQQLSGVVSGGTALEKARLQNLQDEVAKRGDNVTAAKRELDAINVSIAAARSQGGTATQALLTEQANAQNKVKAADYDAYKSNEDLKVKAAGKNSAEVIALRQAELAKAQSLFRSDSEEVKTAASQLASAQEAAANRGAAAGARAAKQQERATVESLDTQIGKAEEVARTDIELTQMRVKAKLLNAKEGEAAEQAAYRTELDSINQLYARELAISGLTIDQIGPIKKKMELEDLKINDQMTINAQKAADEAAKSWQDAMKTVNSAVDGQVSGLLKGTETFRQAMKNIAASLIESGVKNGVNSLLTGVEGVAGKAFGAGGAAGAGAQTANTSALGILTASVNALIGTMGGVVPATLANTTATTVHTAATTTNVAATTANATATGANATGTLANTISTDANTIATNFAATVSAVGHMFGFATGTPFVQQTGVALIHKGEAILPADVNPYSKADISPNFDFGARSGASGGSSADSGSYGGGGSSADSGSYGGGGSGGDTHAHFHVTAMDSRSVRDFFHNNGDHIVSSLSRSMKNGSHLKFANLR